MAMCGKQEACPDYPAYDALSVDFFFFFLVRVGMTTDIEPFERECDAGLDFGTGCNADGASGRGVWVGHK